MFGSKKEEPSSEAGFDSSRIYVWLRGIESKVNNLRRELDLLKSDFAKKQDKLSKEMRTLNDDLIELKREREKTSEKIELIIKELKLTADKEELMTLKKYMDLWNPMNFVTQKDIERVVQEKLEEKETAQNSTN